ncbi:MAG: hypothetical protein DKINENOH_04800 [bacterium]|nr:hypothetical protein [bacterium]
MLKLLVSASIPGGCMGQPPHLLAGRCKDAETEASQIFKFDRILWASPESRHW